MALVSNRYEIDLSNEVLNIDFGQGAAKISEVNVGVRKRFLPTRLTPGAWVRTGLINRNFFHRTNSSVEPFQSKSRLMGNKGQGAFTEGQI